MVYSWSLISHNITFAFSSLSCTVFVHLKTQNLSYLQLQWVKRMSYIQILNSRSCFQTGLVLSSYSRCCGLLTQVTRRTRQRMRVLFWWLLATVMLMIVKTQHGSEQLRANLEVTAFFQICNAINAPNPVCLVLHIFFVYLSGCLVCLYTR